MTGGAGGEFHAGLGSERCHGTGYHGPHAVHEWLEFDAVLADRLAHGDPASFVAAALVGHTMRDHVLALARAGVTTLAEVHARQRPGGGRLMARFAYEGRTARGDKAQGFLEAARIEPFIIVAMAAMVLALGVFLPMWDPGAKALHH